MYLVASSEMRAIREMFLATTFVLCDAAIYHAGVPGTCRAPVGRMETFGGFMCGPVSRNVGQFSLEYESYSYYINFETLPIIKDMIACKTSPFMNQKFHWTWPMLPGNFIKESIFLIHFWPVLTAVEYSWFYGVEPFVHSQRCLVYDVSHVPEADVWHRDARAYESITFCHFPISTSFVEVIFISGTLKNSASTNHLRADS